MGKPHKAMAPLAVCAFAVTLLANPFSCGGSAIAATATSSGKVVKRAGGIKPKPANLEGHLQENSKSRR